MNLKSDNKHIEFVVELQILDKPRPTGEDAYGSKPWRGFHYEEMKFGCVRVFGFESVRGGFFMTLGCVH